MSTSPRSHPRPRARGPVVASLVAVLAGGAAAAGVAAAAIQDPEGGAASLFAPVLPKEDPREASGEAYATAQPGGCVTWRLGEGERLASFSGVPCDQPHRLEVAGRIDLPDDPATGTDAPFPDAATRGRLGAERCRPMIDAYTRGRAIDPAGRFGVTVVPPSEEGWRKGDHSLLCGITSTELDGSPALSSRFFATADQHRTWDPGTCLGVAPEGRPGAPVDCGRDHTIEIVAHLDAAALYADKGDPPDPRTQSELAAQACYDAGVEYVGGAEALRRSTLISTLVLPISPGSWQTGSRTLDCGVMHERDGGAFSLLQGSVRQGVLVDGTTPVAPTTTTIPAPAPAASPAEGGP